jgi:Flp pilus assembly pilin Flp
MKLFKLANTFRNDESGAVTVDWVVLTAAIVGLGIAVYGVVSGGIQDLRQDIATQLTGQAISTSFE